MTNRTASISIGTTVDSVISNSARSVQLTNHTYNEQAYESYNKAVREWHKQWTPLGWQPVCTNHGTAANAGLPSDGLCGNLRRYHGELSKMAARTRMSMPKGRTIWADTFS